MRYIKFEAAPDQAEIDLLVAVTMNPGVNGLSVGQVRAALIVADLLEKCKNEHTMHQDSILTLEDNQYAFLRQQFGETKFRTVSELIVKLADKIENAANVAP